MYEAIQPKVCVLFAIMVVLSQTMIWQVNYNNLAISCHLRLHSWQMHLAVCGHTITYCITRSRKLVLTRAIQTW